MKRTYRCEVGSLHGPLGGYTFVVPAAHAQCSRSPRQVGRRNRNYQARYFHTRGMRSLSLRHPLGGWVAWLPRRSEAMMAVKTGRSRGVSADRVTFLISIATERASNAASASLADSYPDGRYAPAPYSGFRDQPSCWYPLPRLESGT